MTTVDDFSDSRCDGTLNPMFCSGLAIITKQPIQKKDFLSFNNQGDMFWDYEYFLRRGAGLVRLEPTPGKVQNNTHLKGEAQPRVEGTIRTLLSS